MARKMPKKVPYKKATRAKKTPTVNNKSVALGGRAKATENIQNSTTADMDSSDKDAWMKRAKGSYK